MVYKSSGNLQVILSFGKRAVAPPPPDFLDYIIVIVSKIIIFYDKSNTDDKTVITQKIK
jgi:hypothetical protein